MQKASGEQHATANLPKKYNESDLSVHKSMDLSLEVLLHARLYHELSVQK